MTSLFSKFVFWVITLRMQSSYFLKLLSFSYGKFFQSLLFPHTCISLGLYYVYSLWWRTFSFNSLLGAYLITYSSLVPWVTSLHSQALLIWGLRAMHLHNKLCHSVASGEWRVASFLSRPSRRASPYSASPACWGLSACRLSLGTPASRAISPYLGYTSLYPLFCVLRVATSRISH